MHFANALTQETIFGIADGATYSGMLCLGEDGRRYFFTQAQVDGQPIAVPSDHFESRDAALKGLAQAVSGVRPHTKASGESA